MLKQRTGRGYPVSTYLTAPVAEALDRATRETGLVRNQIIKALIEEGLKRRGYIAPEKVSK